MPELIDQPTTPDEAEPSAPAAEKIDHREQQRSALRDLVELSTSSAATEAEIDERLKKSLTEAEDSYKKGVREVEERFNQLAEALAADHQRRVEEARAVAEREMSAVHKRDRDARQRIRNEMEPTERDIKTRFDQAVWMAESVFEAADQTIRAEAKKAKEIYDTQKDALTQLDAQAWSLTRTHGIQVPEDADTYALPLSDNPLADYEAQLALASEHVANLNRVKAPGFLVGSNLYVSAVLFGLLAAGIAQVAVVRSVLPLNWFAIGGAFVVVAGALIAAAFMLKAAAQARVVPLRQALSTASRAAKAQLHTAAKIQEKKRNEAMEARRAEVLGAREQFKPLLGQAAQARDAALASIQADIDARTAAAVQRRTEAANQIEAWRSQSLQELDAQHKAELDAAAQRRDQMHGDAEHSFREARAALEKRLSEGLAHIHAPIATDGSGDTPLNWDDPAWKTWTPPKVFPESVRIGELKVDLKRIADVAAKGNTVRLPLPPPFRMPVTLGFPRQASLLVQHDRDGRPTAIKTLQTAMARLLTQLPAGRARFTIIDPVGLGQNFAGFMHLADHDEQLVGGRIWTEAEQIEQKLTNLTEHMETVIQKYLRNEFDTIDDYNAQAGELAEPYRFLVIADFPVGFQGNAYRRLASIAATGARCGVYTLIGRDFRQPLPGGTHLEELEQSSVNIVQKDAFDFGWKDKVFGQFPLALDNPPGEEVLTAILDKVGAAAKLANRVEVPFDTIAPDRKDYWTRSSTEDLVVPIGRMGATRLQYLRFGKGVAQHALLAGKTGSGKSTLLHAIVTNLAMWYSPDEIEIYLIDFKKGVEFKTYATHHLPHARAIAVESDREFGLSVLQRLDAELTRRGEIFRREGVQDLGAYRRAGGKLRMPRTLLIIDEFQEFFSEDDKLAQEAGLLLDRLVRQGRAFGIHLLLGSQTIGGTSGLARSTIGQMAVRIALQTSEADSHLILGDNNSAARLLSRPGEAIYNDAGGLVEGNSPFQVAWLPDEKREVYLENVQRMATEKYNGQGVPGDLVVFEGNAAADIRTNTRLARLLDAAKRPVAVASAPVAWLGDPVAIKEPTSITFRRQAGTNVLMVGQQEEQAMAITVSAIIALAAQNPPGGAKFFILDGTPADSALATVFPAVKASLAGYDVALVEYRGVESAMNQLNEELKARQSGGGGTEGIFVIVYGLQRYRALRKSEDSFGSFSMSSTDDDTPKATPPDKIFGDLLKEGPPLGIHIIAWADTAVSLDRTLDRNAMREFDNRVLFQMSANDSSNLIDSPAANKLGFHRALAYSEEQGTMEKFRPYALPEKAWLGEVKAKLGK